MRFRIPLSLLIILISACSSAAPELETAQARETRPLLRAFEQDVQALCLDDASGDCAQFRSFLNGSEPFLPQLDCFSIGPTYIDLQPVPDATVLYITRRPTIPFLGYTRIAADTDSQQTELRHFMNYMETRHTIPHQHRLFEYIDKQKTHVQDSPGRYTRDALLAVYGTPGHRVESYLRQNGNRYYFLTLTFQPVDSQTNRARAVMLFAHMPHWPCTGR